jgi:hypothetical protein
MQSSRRSKNHTLKETLPSPFSPSNESLDKQNLTNIATHVLACPQYNHRSSHVVLGIFLESELNKENQRT